MRLLQCSKCYRGFIPEEEKELPIISGRNIAKREDVNLVVCPYCNHVQEEEVLVNPV